MDDSEIFNQRRMDRCADIKHAITVNWQKKNSFEYTIRATGKVSGMDLAELRKQYFAVGVGEDLAELPFHDMLVIFEMIRQERLALEKRQKNNYKPRKNFKINYQISTSFPDEKAAALLAGLQIQTPFDEGKFLRIVAKQIPVDDTEIDLEDDPENPQ